MTTGGPSAYPLPLYSINYFVGDGERVTWDFNFAGGYLDKAHIKAVVEDLGGNREERPIIWVGPNTVNIEPIVPYGWQLTLYRETPKDYPVVDFTDGSTFNETDLDKMARQAVFIAAEAIDRGEGALAEIAPRAILVPAGEIAPAFPPRDTVKGKLLGVDLAGKIVGINMSGGNAVLDAELISFAGKNLADVLRQRISEIELSTEKLEQQALEITAQGEQLVDQATSTQALDSRLAQLRIDHEGLVTLVDQLASLDDLGGLATILQTERSERITADSALAAILNVLGATDGTGKAFILNLSQVKVTPTETLADRLDFLDAEDGEASARISDEETARIAGDAAEAQARQTLGATLTGQISSAVQNEAQARADAVSAEATQRTQLAATLRQETANAVSGEATARNSAITAAINDEAYARVQGDAAEANSRTQLAATLRQETSNAVAGESTARTTAITAAINTEKDARVQGDAAEATARSTLATTLRGEFNGQISAEASSRITQDGVFTGLFTLLGAKTPDGTAFQLDESKVKVGGGVALGSRLSGIDVAIGNANSAVANERQARIDQVGPIASDLSTVQTNVGNLTSSVTALNLSVGGLQAKAGVALDVNGYVTGWVANNNGSSGSFDIITDKFRIVNPGNPADTPFQVINGGVYINGNKIQQGTVSQSAYVSGSSPTVNTSGADYILAQISVSLTSTADILVLATAYATASNLTGHYVYARLDGGPTSTNYPASGTQYPYSVMHLFKNVSAGSHTIYFIARRDASGSASAQVNNSSLVTQWFYK